ncbi:MAG: kinase/pyrophosphorylase [Acidobacteria bacterium]|nr:kinase/pyrophosphorylase [Acidobacteriota bacterium]
MTNYHVLIISDGTGETANRMLKAAMVQFGEDIFVTRHANVREQDQIKSILERISNENILVLHTFASKELRDYMERLASEQGAQSVDLLGPLMETLGSLFHKAPVAQPGLLHRVDEEYLSRMDAIDYAIRHDDKRALKDLSTADIVLLGVSRTSKTPLGLFLAQEGWKVASIAIVRGKKLPALLFEVDQKKIVGLTIDPKRLAEMRRARLQRGDMKDKTYAEMDRINKELEYAHSLYSSNPGWPVIDVTGKSLEEISQEVLGALLGKGRKL